MRRPEIRKLTKSEGDAINLALVSAATVLNKRLAELSPVPFQIGLVACFPQDTRRVHNYPTTLEFYAALEGLIENWKSGFAEEDDASSIPSTN